MAKNNWANEAFKKAQNLMSRGYNDFTPTTVVTKDQLSDLSDVITTSRPSMVGPNQLDEYMQSPWNMNHNEATAKGYQEEAEITGDTYEGPVDINNQPLNTDNFDINAPYGPLDPHDHPKKPEATSTVERWLDKNILGPINNTAKKMFPDNAEKRQDYEYKSALEAIDAELFKIDSWGLERKTPQQQLEDSKKRKVLEHEKRQIEERQRAWRQRYRPEGEDKSWFSGDRPDGNIYAPDSNLTKFNEFYAESKEALPKLGNSIIEGIKKYGKEWWSENKSKLDPNFKTMVEDGIEYVKDLTSDKTIVVDSKFNNPGNIEKSSIKWNGEGKETYSDGRFTTFDTPEAGIRALTKDLSTKLKRHNGDLKAMIAEYAPASENDVKKYLQVVQKTAGKKFKYTEDDLQNIVKGFIRMENKKELADYYINIMEK